MRGEGDSHYESFMGGAEVGGGRHQSFSQILGGCRWASSLCGGWKATTMSEMGGLQLFSRPCGGWEVTVWSHTGRLDVGVKVLWGVKFYKCEHLCVVKLQTDRNICKQPFVSRVEGWGRLHTFAFTRV